MTRLISENGSPATTAKAQRGKANKKAHVAPRRANVAPARAKSARRAKAAKKTPSRQQPRLSKPIGTREGSKTAKIVDLLKRPGGVTSKELMKATGWLPHSVRGFLSGTVGKKNGIEGDLGQRR